MKIILLVLALSSLFVFSCKNSKNNNQHTEKVEIESTAQVKQVNDSNIIQINLKEGRGEATIYKQENQTVYIQFSSLGYKKIRGVLSSPDSLANIRFSQIFIPDGSMDGPFGREISYDLPIEGIYKLSVNENIMAGDPWKGEFVVSIRLYN